MGEFGELAIAINIFIDIFFSCFCSFHTNCIFKFLFSVRLWLPVDVFVWVCVCCIYIYFASICRLQNICLIVRQCFVLLAWSSVEWSVSGSCLLFASINLPKKHCSYPYQLLSGKFGRLKEKHTHTPNESIQYYMPCIATIGKLK